MTPLEKYHQKKANKGQITRKEAINAHCQRCVGGDVDSGWVKRIRECTVNCELHEARPYQEK